MQGFFLRGLFTQALKHNIIAVRSSCLPHPYYYIGAEMEDENWIDSAATLFEPAPQSIADTLLAKVFGNWVLGDASGRGVSEGPLIYNNFLGLDEVTLVSTLLGYSGVLAAAFGLLIGSYTFFMQLVKNSWNGTFAADGVNSIFWPLRSVMAFALIIPVVTIGDPANGRATQITTAQVFMMDIARAGSGFADTTSASYVTNAFAFPVSNHRPPDIPDAVYEMVGIASCAVIGAIAEGTDEPSFAEMATVAHSDGTATGFIAGDYADSGDISDWRQRLQSGQASKKSLEVQSSIEGALRAAFNADDITSMSFGKGGMCGRLEFNKRTVTSTSGGAMGSGRFGSRTASSTVSTAKPSDILTELQSNIRTAYYPAYENLAISVFTSIENIKNSDNLDVIVESAGRADAAATASAKWIHETVIRFNQNLYDNVSGELAGYREKLGGSMFDPIIDGGWAALGAVYTVIPRISNIAVNNIADAHSQLSATPSDFPCADGFVFEDCDAKEQSIALSEALKTLVKQYRASFNDGASPSIRVLDFCSIDQCSVRSVKRSTSSAISTALLSALAEGGQYLNVTNGVGRTGETNAGIEPQNEGALGSRNAEEAQDPNPAVTLSAIGSSMTFIGTTMQMAQLSFATIGKGIEKLSQSNSSVANIIGIALSGIQTAAELLAGFSLSISRTLLTSGFVLSYILPMLPFMIFAMQVVGWLATVGEGMFAVNFAVALLTNSDGDGAINTGFLKALSLTAAIFLKPFFIVIGVALSHAIAAPAFAFFTEQYWLAWDLENAIGAGASNVVFEVSAQLILYIAGSAFLLKFIYSIQHIVPDSSNNWISGGIVNPFGVQGVADGLQSDLKANASAVTEGAAGAAAQSVKQQANRRKK